MSEFIDLSLYGLLSMLDNHDQGITQLTIEALEDINTALLAKVDHWRFYFDKLEDNATRSKKYAHEHMEAANTSLNELERAKDRLTKIMLAHGFSKLKGEQFALALRRSTRVEIEPSSEPTPEVQELFPDFVKSKLSWSKEGLKRALEADKCPLSFVKLTEHQSPIFTARKD